MRKISVVIALLALVACGKKDKEASGAQGTAEVGKQGGASKPIDPPATCPPGNVVKDGTCVAVITAEKVAVVEQQRSRIDELAALLERVDTVAVPIDLMGGLRQLEPWKALVAKNEKLKTFDEIATTLDTAVKQLRTFKAGLGQTSAQLGNLKGELERLLADTGAARRIEEVRAQISSQLRTTVMTFADDVTQTIQGALAPLELRFTDASNLVTLGCAAMALGRAGEESKKLCDQATAAFAAGKKYLADVKARPAQLFEEVTTKLEAELAALIDEQAQQLLDTAQVAVNDALKLPAGGAGPAAAP
jgi:F0F1-type ATP synthase membrane subunit b/b'